MSRNHEVPGWKKVTAATAAALGMFSLTACNEAPAPTPSATATPSADPTEKPSTPATTPEEEPQVDSFEIPAGLEDEELAEVFVDRITDMKNAGATPQFAQDALHVGQESGRDAIIDYARDIAAQNIEALAPQIFTKDALKNEKIKKWLQNLEEINAATLYAYFLTSGGQEGDEEPYRRWWEVTDVHSLKADPGTRKLTIDVYEYENTEKNRMDELGANPIEGPGSVTVTFRTIDGREMIDKKE